MKSSTLERALSGKSASVIRQGRLSQSVMKKLRFTVDDLYEAMRQQNVTHLEDVVNLTVETAGKISILAKEKKSPAEFGYEIPLIKDGKFDSRALREMGFDKETVKKHLHKEEKDTFIFAVDDKNHFLQIEKDS